MKLARTQQRCRACQTWGARCDVILRPGTTQIHLQLYEGGPDLKNNSLNEAVQSAVLITVCTVVKMQ